MAYLIETRRKNPESGRQESYFRIGERISGRQQTRALGFIERREAERLLRVFIGRRAAHEPVEAPPQTGRCSLETWIGKRHADHIEALGCAPKTRESFRVSSAHLKRLLGREALEDVTGAKVEGYIATRRREGVKARTIQIELSWLRKALQLAVEEGELALLPKITRPRVDDARPHVFLSPGQAATLLDALPWETEPASCLAIYIGLDLGLRRGEIMSRRWENVRWEQGANGALYVGSQLVEGFSFRTKSGKGRTVPLTPGLAAALRDWWTSQGRPEAGWIFPRAKNPRLPMVNFKRTLATACANAGLPVLHPHALRHTWATRLAVAGTPRALTQKFGGWSSPEMLDEVYEHALTDIEAEAMARAAVLPKRATLRRSA